MSKHMPKNTCQAFHHRIVSAFMHSLYRIQLIFLSFRILALYFEKSRRIFLKNGALIRSACPSVCLYVIQEERNLLFFDEFRILLFPSHSAPELPPHITVLPPEPLPAFLPLSSDMHTESSEYPTCRVQAD